MSDRGLDPELVRVELSAFRAEVMRGLEEG